MEDLWEQRNEIKQFFYLRKCKRCKCNIDNRVLEKRIGLDCNQTIHLDNKNKKEQMWYVPESKIVYLCNKCHKELKQWLNISS
jgi:hypothetical protein